MRNPNNWTTFALGTEPVLLTGRGYTGYSLSRKAKRFGKHLHAFELINMNGRLYDPVLGRFLNPDNVIQSPDFSQSYNRFTYCLNNPMLYIDPSGNSWLSNFGNWIGRNMGSILTGVYLAASVVACIVAPPLGGAMLGAYLGGLNANGGQLNAGAWNWKSASTWLGIGFGAAFGAIGAYGLANPGSIAMKLGYIAPGIGALGLTANGTDFSFKWSTAAGGGGNYSLNGNQAPTAQQIADREIAEAREGAGQGGSGWLDNLQTGLDVAGIADPTGLLDLGNALIYAGQGQWGNAGISTLAIIPYIGDAGKTVRLGSKVLKILPPSGFKHIKQFGYPHGQKVYEYNGKYFSKDLDSHNGGVWKVFEEVNGKLKRIGTADENLKIFKN